MGYYLYKGLKKPLVFFGLKDKYIYQALGLAVLGIITMAVATSIIGLLGLVVGIVIGGGGVWWVFKMQDTKGLYNKMRNHEELHIFPKRVKVKRNRN